MRTNVCNLYLDWIIDKIRYSNMVETHRMLLKHFHTKLFLVKDPRDQSRENDGVDLRWRFAWESGHPTDNLQFVDISDEERCTVLEMMAGLSLRVDEEITKISNDNSTAPMIFWCMVNNMGLLDQTDKTYDCFYVSNVLDTFNNRLYEPNGNGGLFRFDTVSEDLRNIEIWHQMNWWVNKYLK